MSTDPDSLSDPALLRNLLSNAKRLGREDIVLKCQVRLAQLEGGSHRTPMEQEFWAAVAAAEEFASAKNGRTTRLVRTRQKVARVGFKKCLADWAVRPGTTQGFDLLVEAGHPELTGEAVIVRYATEFPPEIVEAARSKLIGVGIDPSNL